MRVRKNVYITRATNNMLIKKAKEHGVSQAHMVEASLIWYLEVFNAQPTMKHRMKQQEEASKE